MNQYRNFCVRPPLHPLLAKPAMRMYHVQVPKINILELLFFFNCLCFALFVLFLNIVITTESGNSIFFETIAVTL